VYTYYQQQKNLTMKENPEYEVGNVIVRMSNLRLWKYRKPSVTPKHSFRLSIVNYDLVTLFFKDVTLEGYSTDFEVRDSAMKIIMKVLKGIDPDLFPQTKDDKEKFNEFMVIFNDKLNKIFQSGKAWESLL